jgi:hypothetical protein
MVGVANFNLTTPSGDRNTPKWVKVDLPKGIFLTLRGIVDLKKRIKYHVFLIINTLREAKNTLF